MHRAAAFLLLSVFTLSAQSIQYSDARKVWLLTTRQSSYAMGLGADGALRHLYWGAPLWRIDDLAAPPQRRDISSFDPRQMLEAEEFPGWGGPRYYEPALKITRENGNRDLVLRYSSHRIAGDNLDIVLQDLNDPIEVTLHYRVYPDYGILRRSATIRNATQRSLTVESAPSVQNPRPRGTPHGSRRPDFPSWAGRNSGKLRISLVMFKKGHVSGREPAPTQKPGLRRPVLLSGQLRAPAGVSARHSRVSVQADLSGGSRFPP